MMKKYIVLVALIAILSLASSSDSHSREQTISIDNTIHLECAPSYTPYSPIVISSNGDFIIQGWDGTGSSTNPFRIENLSIHQDTESGYCINISNTNVYFKIQNCILSGNNAKAGIYLDGVINGIIDNNTVNTPSSDSLWSQSIALVDSDLNIISNNTCIFRGHGVDLLRSDSNIIFNNTCNGGSDGIWLDESSSNIIANNTSGGHTQGAVMVSGGSANIIANNSLWDSQRGINLGASPSNTVVNNTMVNCGYMVPWSQVFQTEVYGNTVNGLPMRYHQSDSGFAIDEPSGQVVLVDCSNFVVEDLEIGAATIGVEILECQDGIIRNITSADQPWYGIEIQDSRNISVIDCRMYDCGTGLSFHGDLAEGEGSHLAENCTIDRVYTGISIWDNNCKVSWNTFLLTY
ncbi:MAG: right-handed parallel beta-helix repeat-containing protein, partial [Candidatus Thorarchaeota archaeon]